MPGIKAHRYPLQERPYDPYHDIAVAVIERALFDIRDTIVSRKNRADALEFLSCDSADSDIIFGLAEMDREAIWNKISADGLTS